MSQHSEREKNFLILTLCKIDLKESVTKRFFVLEKCLHVNLALCILTPASEKSLCMPVDMLIF